jgi:hypothetical protein
VHFSTPTRLGSLTTYLLQVLAALLVLAAFILTLHA